MKTWVTLTFTLMLILLSVSSMAVTLIHHIGPQSDKDVRFDYDNELLVLALENTLVDFGAYELRMISGISYERAYAISKGNRLENFVFKNSASNSVVKALGYVNFPVDLGIVGYRVFFTTRSVNEKLLTVSSLDQLRTFQMLQGSGWLDNDILLYNKFTVTTGPDYDGLFRMVNAGRAELFPRGVNEIFHESSKQFPLNPNVVLNESLALYYPLPRFFFTHKANTKLIERLSVGLKRAYENGTLFILWNKYYQESLALVNLKGRQLFKLDNPFISDVDPSYEQYIYNYKKSGGP